MNVINQPTSVIMELSSIVKIREYKRLHEGHHFIPMAMEVHNTPRHDMDCLIKKCVHLFHDRRSEGHLSLSFCIQFFRQHVNIALLHVLTSTIERKLALTRDVCSRPPIIIKTHDLHASNIKRVMGEKASYHKRD